MEAAASAWGAAEAGCDPARSVEAIAEAGVVSWPEGVEEEWGATARMDCNPDGWSLGGAEAFTGPGPEGGLTIESEAASGGVTVTRGAPVGAWPGGG